MCILRTADLIKSLLFIELLKHSNYRFSIVPITEEVFDAAEAMWFSPNGTYLAVASFNDTQVESAVYPYYGESSEFDNQYPLMVHFKYPKVSLKLLVAFINLFCLLL